MKNTFKVYREQGDLYLEPQFQRHDLNDWEEAVMRYQEDHFREGRAHIHAQDQEIFNPPEEITFLELYDRYDVKESMLIGPDPEDYDIR